MQAGLALGARTRLMQDAWWTTTLVVPDEPTPRLAIMEKSFPGSCVVNRDGKRFANESQNYMAFQKALFKTHTPEHPNAPAWHVFDARFRKNLHGRPHDDRVDEGLTGSYPKSGLRPALWPRQIR